MQWITCVKDHICSLMFPYKLFWKCHYSNQQRTCVNALRRVQGKHSGLSRCNGTKTYNAYISDDVVHGQAFVKVAIMNILEKMIFLKGTPSSSVVTIVVGMTWKQAGENPKFFRFCAVFGKFSKFFQHVVRFRWLDIYG